MKSILTMERHMKLTSLKRLFPFSKEEIFIRDLAQGLLFLKIPITLFSLKIPSRRRALERDKFD